MENKWGETCISSRKTLHLNFDANSEMISNLTEFKKSCFLAESFGVFNPYTQKCGGTEICGLKVKNDDRFWLVNVQINLIVQEFPLLDTNYQDP